LLLLSVVLVQYELPDFLNDSAGSIIASLLVRRQAARLGNLSKGYLEVKNHRWFQDTNIDFKGLLNIEIAAPWKPTIKDPLDLSNFENYSASEKEVDVSRRLTPEEHEKFLGF
jgi:cGMP-dependent protein kinase 1